MSGHTPGPWRVDPEDPLHVYADETLSIATITCEDEEEAEATGALADAALIAAAPELADALEALYRERWLCSPRDHRNPTPGSAVALSEASMRAIEALRKAGRLP